MIARDETLITSYLLDCGHTADVAGPCGATTGHAWCGECGESAEVVGYSGALECDKCGREVHPWPLERGNRCSPKGWVSCIRNDGMYGRALA